MNRPRVFISHCEKNFKPTAFAIGIIDLIGCIPVIAEKAPKKSRPVSSLVFDTIDSCDAALVIATPDTNGSSGKSPSQSVTVEIGNLQIMERLKGKYFIVKEESVNLGAMIPETHYKFSGSDYAPIAEAILIELGSMGLFRNYYELPGSDLKLHELMETLSQLRNMSSSGVVKKEIIQTAVEDIIKNTVENIMQGVS